MSVVLYFCKEHERGTKRNQKRDIRAMQTEPIRLDFLPAHNIEVSKRLNVTFRYPDINHPVYGIGEDMEGSIDFILPQGSFPISNFFEMSANLQDNLIENYVRRLRNLHDELDDAEMKIRYRDWLTICCLIFPTEDVHSKIFKSVSDIFAIIFHLDDLADDEDVMDELGMTTANLYRSYDNWQRLFDTGNTEYYNKIALQFPILENGFRHLADAVEEMLTSVPGFREKLRFPNRALFESSETVPLVTHDLEYDGDMLSEEALKTVRGINAGFQMPLEFIASVQGIELPEKVRQSLLFEIFLNGFNLGSGLFNDVFGLNKDMAKSASKDNCILRKVVREGMSLKEAFDHTLKLLRDTTNDTRLAGRKLIETFPEKGSVQKFIQIAEYIYDGQIYSYLLLFKLKGRYGSIHFNIVQQT